MKERPILFSGEMVRAILEGRKTQTRRVIKLEEFRPCTNVPRSDWYFRVKKDGLWSDVSTARLIESKCPYGVPGDRLWVRESFNWSSDADLSPNENHKKCPERAIYTAQNVVWKADGQEFNPNHPEWGYTIWKPSIHMPRWASRILLEVVNVRVERVQDIDEFGAIAEGAEFEFNPFMARSSSLYGFRNLWDSINGKKYPWNANPWVWVIEFKVLEVNHAG